MLWLLLACRPAPQDSPSPVDTDTGPPPCGSAGRELATGLTELAFDDGSLEGDMRERGVRFGSVYGGDINSAEQPSREGVRFTLDSPATVHGFAIQWTGLPEDPEHELTAGVYADFGYNGFDWWYDEPLWEGSRCVEDSEDGQWLVYALDEPLEIADPGLIYVAHSRSADGPAFGVDWSDGQESWWDDCGDFDACTSTLNLPEADAPYYQYGTTLPTEYHFMARLYVSLPESDPEPWLVRTQQEQSIGSRHSWGDVDGDGWVDLLTGSRLYRNNQGTLELVEDPFPGVSVSGGVFGDYDNDGCLDLFAFVESTSASDSLWRGDCSFGFTDTTESAGISDVVDFNCQDDAAQDRAPSPAAAWWDIDSDGLLDLYVSNFICWDSGDGYVDNVWRNNGDGSFSDWTGLQGFKISGYTTRGAAPADADGDGDVDLMVNNYRLQRNLFYDNLGGGYVKEQAIFNDTAGHAVDGAYGHTIGVAWGDLDGDGDLDLVSANLAHPRWYSFSDKTQILLNDGAGDFTDLAEDFAEGPSSASGLRYQETYSVPVLADFDQDGALDLAVSAVYDGRPSDLYWGVGDGSFTPGWYGSGLDVTGGWGMAVADLDNDGDQDLAAKGALYENTLDGGHWLQIALIGDVDSNRGAYGATVWVESGAATFTRHVQGGSGQGNQDSPYLHFGLGELDSVDSVRVAFPGGQTVTYTGPFTVDQRYWLRESGSAEAGWVVVD